MGKLLDVLPVNKQVASVTLFVGGMADQGVGYAIFVTQEAALQFQVGDTVTLWLHHHYNEKVNELYGFTDKRVKSLFVRLLAVSGVGPKVALSIVSTFSVDQMREIIDRQQAERLRSVPGLGAKTAAKVIVELSSDKDFSKLLGEETSGQSGAPAQLELIRSTLERLGYRSYEIELLFEKHQEQLRTLAQEPNGVELIIKLLLQDGN